MCAEVLIGEFGVGINKSGGIVRCQSVGDGASNKDDEASNKDGDGGGSITASTTTLFLVDFPLSCFDFLLVTESCVSSKGNSCPGFVNGAYIGAPSSDES